MVRPPFFPFSSLSPFVCAPPHLHHLLTPSDLICLPSTASAPTLRCTRATMLHCRQDNGSVCDPPIYAGFGPQNITVIMSQESHYCNAFLIRIHFPHPPKYGSYGSYYTSLERSG